VKIYIKLLHYNAAIGLYNAMENGVITT